MIITVTLNPTIDKTLEAPDFHVGGHLQAKVRELLVGGKGINVAIGLARLGSPVAACALVGRNELEFFRKTLKKCRVKPCLCRVEGVTRTNTTVLDPVNRTATHLRERGFEVGAGEVAAVRSTLERTLSSHGAPEHDRVVFAGSLPPGVKNEDFVGLIGVCAGAGARVVVDTNGDPLRAAVDSGDVHTVKPNLEELGHCVGDRVPRAEAAERAAELLDRVSTVLVTLGAEGAYVIARGLRLGMKCPLLSSEVRSAVGAGDAFLAGWLHGLEGGCDEGEALRWAVAAGAASVTAETTTGYTAEQVRRLLRRCEGI